MSLRKSAARLGVAGSLPQNGQVKTKGMRAIKPIKITAASSSSLGCCAQVSLDELVNFGLEKHHHGDHGAIHLPAGSAKIAKTAGMTYACAAGMKIGWDIFKHYGEVSRDLIKKSTSRINY